MSLTFLIWSSFFKMTVQDSLSADTTTISLFFLEALGDLKVVKTFVERS